jgi:Fe-S cluster biogenesis protein NfuA
VTVTPSYPALVDADLTFACPRCSTQVADRFYGPCSSCRSQLNAVQHGTAKALEAERFEPRLHVVPNHVATKE